MCYRNRWCPPSRTTRGVEEFAGATFRRAKLYRTDLTFSYRDNDEDVKYQTIRASAMRARAVMSRKSNVGGLGHVPAFYAEGELVGQDGTRVWYCHRSTTTAHAKFSNMLQGHHVNTLYIYCKSWNIKNRIPSNCCKHKKYTLRFLFWSGAARGFWGDA